MRPEFPRVSFTRTALIERGRRPWHLHRPATHIPAHPMPQRQRRAGQCYACLIPRLLIHAMVQPLQTLGDPTVATTTAMLAERPDARTMTPHQTAPPAHRHRERQDSDQTET